jgi:hypothetical protein
MLIQRDQIIYEFVAADAISLFGCILCCKALVLYLFHIALDSAVPCLSSNVPIPVSVFK